MSDNMQVAPEACPKCGAGVYQRKDNGSRFFNCGTIRWNDGEFQQTAMCRFDELERIVATAERDAARYRFIRDELARRLSLHMDATAAWRVQSPPGRHPTFDAAIDSMMAAEPHREEA